MTAVIIKIDRGGKLCYECESYAVVLLSKEPDGVPHQRKDFICLECGCRTWSINVPILSVKYTAKEEE